MENGKWSDKVAPFKIGDRVKLSKIGRDCYSMQGEVDHVEGTVIDYRKICTDSPKYTIDVEWDEPDMPRKISSQCLESATPNLAISA